MSVAGNRLVIALYIRLTVLASDNLINIHHIFTIPRDYDRNHSRTSYQLSYKLVLTGTWKELNKY